MLIDCPVVNDRTGPTTPPTMPMASIWILHRPSGGGPRPSAAFTTCRPPAAGCGHRWWVKGWDMCRSYQNCASRHDWHGNGSQAAQPHGGTADPGPAPRCPFLHRPVRRRVAGAGDGRYLHSCTPPPARRAGPPPAGSDDDERLADCETVPEGSFGGSWTSWPGAKRAGFARAGYARMRDA